MLDSGPDEPIRVELEAEAAVEQGAPRTVEFVPTILMQACVLSLDVTFSALEHL